MEEFVSFNGGGDNQTAVAVQSLLDSQTIPEVQDEEDLFQCGKCKKQFNSLPSFVGHKQSECTVPPIMSTLRPVQPLSSPQTSYTTTTYTTVPPNSQQQALNQPLSAYNAVPTSPNHITTQNLVLTEDLMTFTNLDPGLHNSTIQMVTTPFQNRSNTMSLLNPINVSTTFTANGTTYTQPSSYTQNIAIQPAQQTQPGNILPQQQPNQQTQPGSILPTQITITPISSHDLGKQLKPTTKAGRRSRTNVNRNMKEGEIIIQGSMGDSGNPVQVQVKKKLKCQYCQKLFSKNFDLQQHIRAHTGVKPFQCIVCGRAFAQKSNVKKHMSTHKVWPTGMTSSLPEQPLSHVVSNEEGEGEGDPDQPPTQTVNINDQQPVDSSPSSELSDKTLNSKVKVVIDNSYVCHYCPAKFKSYFQLKSHMVEHKVEQVYKCVMKNCCSTFQELDAFLEHTKTHEEEMSYRCHLCNKYFPSLYDLGVHQYTHSLYPNQGPKPGPRHFQCNKCLNKYSTPEALDAHLASTSHQYQCPHCDKNFTCERYLRRHLPTHGTEGQFQCNGCWKKFKTEHYLKMHLLIHTGEKPFSCHICNNSFNRKDKLKRHLLIHDSVKKYRCPFKTLTGCTKEFSRPDKLKAHIISHSGIKPYKCSVCNKGFSRKPHLVEHERGHKADYRYKCEKCGKGFFRPKLFSEHKCTPPKVGMESNQLFRAKNRKKVGRPKKKVPDPVPSTESSNPAIKPYGTRSTTRPKPVKPNTDIEEDGGKDDTNTIIKETTSSKEIDIQISAAIKSSLEMTSTVNRVLTTSSNNMFEGNTVVLDAHKPPSAMYEHDIGQGDLIDHYVVHLAEASDGSAPTIQTTFIPGGTGAQVITENGATIPVTIIEAQGVQLNEHGYPVSRDEVVTAQVLVASSQNGQQTLVTCPATLVDYNTHHEHDPVLQGTENLLKASAEILSSQNSKEILDTQSETLHNHSTDCL